MLRWDCRLLGSTGLLAGLAFVGGVFGREVAYAIVAITGLLAALLGGLWAWRHWERRTAAGQLHRAVRLQTARLRQLPGFAQASRHVFLLLGPSFAGKSQMLKQAGLTRICETHDTGAVHIAPPVFWLGEAGLFIELPGVLVESQALRAYVATLRYLRAHRIYRKNLRGVLLCLEAGVCQSPQPHVESLRAPLEHVARCFGVRPPVFLILTQADSFVGFAPCFAQLADTHKDAPWGVALPAAAAGAQQVRTGFASLLTRLRRLTRLQLSGLSDVQMRRAGFGLVQRIADLTPGLLHTVETVFTWQNNIYAPVLRGVYLCAAGGESYGAARSVFCATLLRQVLPEVGAATRPVDYPGWRGLWQRCHLPLLGLGLVCLLLCWQAAALVANRHLVRAAHGAMVAATAAAPAAAAPHSAAAAADAWLAALEAMRPLEQQLGRLQRDLSRGAPWYLRGGLSQGAKLLKPLSQAFTTRLQAAILAPLCSGGLEALNAHITGYQATLAAPSGPAAAQLAHHLKAYLLLTGPKLAGEPAAQGELMWLQDYLRAQLAEQLGLELDATDAARFHEALSRYMAPATQQAGAVWRRDGHLVQQARAMLESSEAPELLVQMFAADVRQRNASADVSLATLLGGIKSPLKSAYSVDSIYTRDGYELFGQAFVAAQKRGGDLWVLRAKPLGAEALRRHALQVERRYYERYIDTWQQLLDSIKIDEPRDLQQALAAVLDLTRNEPPPLVRLWRAIAHHTHLAQDGCSPEAPISPRTSAQRWLARVQQAAQVLRAPSPEVAFAAARSKGAPPRLHPVQQAFANLTHFGIAAPGAGAAETFLHGYQDRLLAIKQALQGCVLDSRESDKVLSLIQQFSQETVDAIGQSEPSPAAAQRLHNLLVQPLQAVAKSLARGARLHRGETWCASVVEPFEALRHSYPFDPAGLDAPLADVLSFYRPDSGQLWRYYNKELAQDILPVGEHFGFDSRLGGAMRLAYAPELLDFLNQAHLVTRAVFGDGQEGMTLEMRLLPEPAVERLELEVSGVKIAGGTQEWTAMHWPGPKPSQGAQLIVSGHNGTKETLKHDGVWGLFRLLESGSVHGEVDTNIVRIDWPLAAQRGRASLEVRVLRRHNLLLSPSRRPALWGALRDARGVPPARIAQGLAPCRIGAD